MSDLMDGCKENLLDRTLKGKARARRVGHWMMNAME